MKTSEELFRELREKWFQHILMYKIHERQDSPNEEYYIFLNKELKQKFDDDTIALINGKNRNIAPRCGNDLGEKHG